MNVIDDDIITNTSGSRKRVPLVLTARDYAIFRSLFDSRVLTATHLADIHFSGSRGAAKQRLWLLGKAGYIAGRFGTPAGLPLPLRLTRKGFEHLQQSGHLTDYPRVTWQSMSKRFKVAASTLAHELDVGSVKASLFRTAREVGNCQINVAVTWPRLLRFRVRPKHLTRPIVVSPDGFFRVSQQSADQTVRQFDFFLELDRSTETLTRIVERAHGYLEYFTSGSYAKRQGAPDAQPQDFPFRSCWVFPTKQRKEHFLSACRNHLKPIRKLVWASVIEDARKDPFGPIWQRPIDADDERHALIAPAE